MWASYMLFVFTRWNSGWRGRRAAVLSASPSLVAAKRMGGQLLHGVHRFLQL